MGCLLLHGHDSAGACLQECRVIGTFYKRPVLRDFTLYEKRVLQSTCAALLLGGGRSVWAEQVVTRARDGVQSSVHASQGPLTAIIAKWCPIESGMSWG